MAVQVILLIGLSERKPILPRQPEQATVFYAVTEAPPDSPIAAVLALTDPTLFALPHPRGFSGPAWLNAAPLRHQSTDWTEPQRWLTQSHAKLGETFEEFLRTNVVANRSLAVKPVALPERARVSPLPIRSPADGRVPPPGSMKGSRPSSSRCGSRRRGSAPC